VLFKGGTDSATVVRPFADELSGIGRAEPAQDPTPQADAMQHALAGAQAENEELRARLHQFEVTLRDQLAQAREAGRRQAAEEHVRNDDAQLAELSAALSRARESFVDELRDGVQAFAVQLACAALQRLVDVQSDDSAWLMRIVARRLAEIDSESVVAVVLPEKCRAIALQLEAPAGASVVFDPGMSGGHARINLRVGGIPIRIEDGLTRLLTALNPELDPYD